MVRAVARKARPTGEAGRAAMGSSTGERSFLLDAPALSVLQTEVLRTVQRLAGNRAVVNALAVLQRQEPALAPPTSEVGPDGPGRRPKNREEQDLCGSAFPNPDTARFRIVVEPAHGYNCFAWAVGITSREITSDTIWGVGKYGPNLDGWTKYLAEHHGFGRSVVGLDPTADVILYGDSATAVSHAARRADVSFGDLTFTSKVGGRSKTPVILHAPGDIEGGEYGRALRSFWRGAASQALPAPWSRLFSTPSDGESTGSGSLSSARARAG